MHWIELNSQQQIPGIKELSHNRPQVIFKHSTRCSLSSIIRNRLEKAETPASADFYLLDLIRYRTLSDKIAEEFSVHHESPQVILIKKAECIYEESHGDIRMEDISGQLGLI